jgi:pimeloyl-ACP methyl ester carboxylesterase
MPEPGDRPARKAPRRRRKRWLVALAIGLALVVALVAGCSVLSPSFEPAVPSAPMVANGVVGRTVEVEGGSIYLVSTPERPGTAVVFVHGSPGTWEAFRGWLTEPALASRARLLSVDRPGFGGSDRGRAESSLAVQARRIAAALTAVGVERAVFVGHSLGGPVIARLAVDAPQRVAGLLFIAPSIDPALEKHRWYNVFGEMLVVQWFLPVDWVTSNREIWPLRGELARMAPELASVRVPVIVVQGEVDNLVPPANAAFVKRAFAAAEVELRMIPKADHFVLWQQPAIVTRAIGDLLERGEAASPGQ